MDKTRKLEADNRITEEYIMVSANKIWQNQPRTAGAVVSEALRAVNLAYEWNSVFFSGKSKRGIVGGLFYCLGLALRSFKTQKEIARILGTTEMTVRASSREWQKQFPDLIKRK
jgi:transcription initiation factor TFIIIB Brf1 subunit/transcription initiation factor TFIIB